MKQYLLLTSALVLLSSVTEAQSACIQTPSCFALGYDSQTACENGLKCPFGEAWYCKVSLIQDEAAQAEKAKACVPGAVFNSDRSCTEKQEVGKVPIGVVVYADGKGHGQAMALDTVSGSSTNWGIHSLDLSTSESQDSSKYYSVLTLDKRDGEGYSYSSLYTSCISSEPYFVWDSSLNKPYASLEEASFDLDSKGGTDKLVAIAENIYSTVKAQFDYAQTFDQYLKNNYNGVGASWVSGTFSIRLKNFVDNVRAFKTTGTSAGEWNIPAPAIFNSIKLNYDAINSTYKTLGRTFYPGGKMSTGYLAASSSYKIVDLRCPLLNSTIELRDKIPYSEKYSTYKQPYFGNGTALDGSHYSYSGDYYRIQIPKEDAAKLPYVTIKAYQSSSYSPKIEGLIQQSSSNLSPSYIVGNTGGMYGTTTSGLGSTYPVIDF